ncbi:MAG: 50S ribosomal protein L23 [Gemmatimonadaceae bacterium]|jgi:large subunit ribosomal protein L23|nr:50S ribosomal protein L23 [Gemmatimonadaceae bacterium]
MPTLHQTILRPLITEKSSAAYQTRGEYTFVVAPKASKGEIKQAIERLFGVTVTGVWTSLQRGKARRVGQSIGNRPNWKKAIVTLKSGDSIPVFEG